MKNNIIIAPCGMNCSLCLGFQREKNKCPGCRADWQKNKKYIRKCIIRNCAKLIKNKWKFCSSQCENYPCRRLKQLDERYQRRYGMSEIENLENIQKYGIQKFKKAEIKKWTCKKCGLLFCVHRPLCQFCGNKKIMTQFQNKVLNKLKRIPVGRVTTYKSLASAIGYSQAARAVGNALHNNPNAPVVPCHRVVCSDGSVGGYADGSAKKIALLKKEGVQVKKGKIVDFRNHLYLLNNK